jgi:glycosyltransferase involved in cell wall biosynthesis
VYRGLRIAIVMPAYQVANYVGQAVRSVPSWVDEVLVIDDASSDETATTVAALGDPRVTMIRRRRNGGVGAAISSGYREVLRRIDQGPPIDVAVVMAGDGQMDPADLPALLDPIAEGRADYVKGNRFRHPDLWRRMPKARIVGNALLSLLTRLSSGYPQLFDSQCGYTAISRATLQRTGAWLYPRYGYLNELLVRLRLVEARLVEVPVRPVYEGQPSGIRLTTVLHPILSLVLRSMLWRWWVQRLRPLLLGRQARRLPDADRAADHLLPAPRR